MGAPPSAREAQHLPLPFAKTRSTIEYVHVNLYYG
jgi:hypothetical protein